MVRFYIYYYKLCIIIYGVLYLSLFALNYYVKYYMHYKCLSLFHDLSVSMIQKYTDSVRR